MKRTNGPYDRRRSLRPLLWLVLAAIAAAVSVSSLHAQETPEATPEEEGTLVVIDPPDEVIAVGDEFAVEVRVEGVEHLAAFDFTLEFDSVAMGYLAANALGDFLGSGERPDVACDDPIVEDGAVSVSCATAGEPTCLGGPAGASGDGLLGRFSFTADAPAVAGLQLVSTGLVSDDVQPCDPDEGSQVEISHTSQPGDVLLARPSRTAQETPAIVRVESPAEEVTEGDEFEVRVTVEGVEGLASFEFAIPFDAALMSFVGMEDLGQFLESGDRTQVICGDPKVREQAVLVSCATAHAPLCLGGPEGPSGSGLLARVVFKAEADGEATLSLADPTSLILDDIIPCDPLNVQQATQIPLEREGALVEIKGSGGFPWLIAGIVAGVAAVVVVGGVAVLQFSRRGTGGEGLGP